MVKINLNLNTTKEGKISSKLTEKKYKNKITAIVHIR
jgi:hypothetical protein